MNIQNLGTNFDPFADTGEVDNDVQSSSSQILDNIGLDLRIQQRNGRKTLTTVQGLPPDLDQKKLLKAFKKVFACNGTIVEDEELGEVIQLQGDHRNKVHQFLVEEKIASKDQIKIHGF